MSLPNATDDRTPTTDHHAQDARQVGVPVDHLVGQFARERYEMKVTTGIAPAMCEQLTHITFMATDQQWRKLSEYWEDCGFKWERISRCTKDPMIVWVQMKRKDQP